MLARILALLIITSQCLAVDFFTDEYDSDIKKASKMYLIGVDWRLMKAQFFQESGLNAKAANKSGAKGLAQFMPATWNQIRKEMRYDYSVSPFHAESAIYAGTYYMGKLERYWTHIDDFENRWKITQSSYNAGIGNIKKAEHKSGGNSYESIITSLKTVTGKRSRETLDYVKKIWNYYKLMIVD